MPRKHIKSKTNWLVIILIIIAIALGCLIYQKKKSQPPISMKEGNVVSNNQQANSYPLPEDLTDEERALFPPPANDSSEAEQREFHNKVSIAAKDTGSLDITRCERPVPLVLKLTEDQKFTLVNNHTDERELVIDPEHIYKVPAGGETALEADFGKGPGIYGYGCGQSGRAVGILFIVPKE